MLNSKLGKKFVAGASALAMVASASATSISTTLTAFAGVMTGEGTFEEGAGLPWHVCENGTGQHQVVLRCTVAACALKLNDLHDQRGDFQILKHQSGKQVVVPGTTEGHQSNRCEDRFRKRQDHTERIL